MGSPSQREERQSERPGKARRDYYSTNEITNESTNQKEGACNGPRDNQRNNNCNDNDDVYKILWTVKRIEVERRAFSPHVKRPVIIIKVIEFGRRKIIVVVIHELTLLIFCTYSIAEHKYDKTLFQH